MALILDRDYFDNVYQSSDDPWSFASRWYETRKYSVIMASLPGRRYRRAFEPGCSIGILSAMLAARCDAVVSLDISEKAVAASRRTVPSNVSVEVGAVPDAWPGGSFDLIMLSDVCHYFDRAGLRQIFAAASDSLAPGGVLVAAHWRHPVPEYPSDGDTVHSELGKMDGLIRTVEHVEADFRLDVCIRAADGADPRNRSVAAAEGWLGT